VRDRFDRGYAIKLLSYIGMAIALAPMIAPTLGAIVSLTVGWRGIFFVLMTFALLVLVLCHFFLPETNKRKVSMAPRELMRGYLSVLMHPSHMAHSLINVFLFAALICFVTSAPHIFMMDLGGTKQEFAFYFGFNAVILMLGNFVVSRVSHRVGFIPMMAVASCLTIVGGTLIAYFARNHEVTTAWRILVPMMLVSLGLTFGAPNSLTGALAPFPDRAGMAAALNGCLKFAAVGLVAWLLSLTPGYRAHWMGIYMCACGVAALIFCAIVWRMPASHDWAASGTAADIASELGATH
jgi:DHA1 family bicyclomycin/chloramphenicol resistance-like MFS transporter